MQEVGEHDDDEHDIARLAYALEGEDGEVQQADGHLRRRQAERVEEQ